MKIEFKFIQQFEVPHDHEHALMLHQIFPVMYRTWLHRNEKKLVTDEAIRLLELMNILKSDVEIDEMATEDFELIFKVLSDKKIDWSEILPLEYMSIEGFENYTKFIKDIKNARK